MDKLPGRNTFKKQIMPGIWEDTDGNHHLSIPDMLTHLDLLDTPENRALAETIFRELMAEQCPDATIIKRETPD